jgi:ATP-dependent Clp protease ATP-binding subunit ClpC
LREFLSSRVSESLLRAIDTASSKCEAAGTAVGLADLLATVLADPTVRSRVSAEQHERALAELAAERSAAPPAAGVLPGAFSFDLALFVEPLLQIARDWGAERVTPPMFVAACLAMPPLPDVPSARAQEALRRSGLAAADLIADREAVGRSDFTCRSLGFGTDLTAMAAAGYWPDCPVVGLEQELKRLTCLVGTRSDSVVVVGEPGVGKSAIVNGLAYHVARRTRPLIPEDMAGWSVVMITPTNLTAGTGGRGELEKRLDEMLRFFRKNPGVVPFFDEIHRLLEVEDPTARTIATALKPPMASGQFRCVGATTDREYERFIAADEAMNSRFTRLLIPEPDVRTAVEIIRSTLRTLVPPAAAALGVTVAPEVVRKAVELTVTYQRTDRLPRKAIRLLRSAVAEKSYRLQTTGKGDSPALSGADVAETFSGLSGIPVQELSDPGGQADRLRGRLSGRVRGQPAAIDAVAGWLELHGRGWLDSRRPRGRFLFLGPPGVGKTELALGLAEELMRDRAALVVKNMAEYQGEGARTRFMGADPGYVGFGQTPTIYGRVLMRPFSVVVLDEFEKADEALADPLLSILDGYAEDSQGRWVDFSQCVFALTSNALAGLVTPEAAEDEIRQTLLRRGGIFTPPLVDRIDRIVMFRPLDEATLLRILEDMVARRRTGASRPLPPELDRPETLREIVGWAAGGGPAQSARGLERALLRWLARSARSD